MASEVHFNDFFWFVINKGVEKRLALFSVAYTIAGRKVVLGVGSDWEDSRGPTAVGKAALTGMLSEKVAA